jgi:hypothetical protein
MLKLKFIVIFAILLLIFTFAGKAGAEYTVTEILFIPWGEGPNELEIREPYREYGDDFEPDTVGFLVPAYVPDQAFVDRDENIYFSSYDVRYFKGFDTNGQVIVDYSAGKTEFRDEFFRGMYNGFYVDSLGRIYCNGNELAGAYVAVADRNNNLLAKLNPLGPESDSPVSIFRWGSDDVLIFNSEDHGLYTYINGQFYPGGTISWRAKDGIYYTGVTKDPSTIRFIRTFDPDSTARPASEDTTFITYEPGNLIINGFLGVDDSMRFYIDCLDSSSTEKNVRIYDQGLKLLDEFRFLPLQGDIYLWQSPHPFLRHDGNVYEFHCRDDGMHVFRWSKK